MGSKLYRHVFVMNLGNCMIIFKVSQYSEYIRKQYIGVIL